MRRISRSPIQTYCKDIPKGVASNEKVFLAMTPRNDLGSGPSSFDHDVATSLGSSSRGPRATPDIESGDGLPEKVIVENGAMCPAVLEAEVRDTESTEGVLGVERPRRAQVHGLSAGKSPEDSGEITGADLRWIAKDLLRTLFGDNSQVGAR